MSRILVIEDDQTIGGVLVSALSANGYSVQWQLNGGGGLAAAAAGADLVLLDLGLPDRDGFGVCRELRSILPGAVIVVLTARREVMDVVSGLESGADDYLIKPFRVIELLARVRAHLRRNAGSATDADGASSVVVLGSLRIDGARRAVVGEVEVPLRAREFDLLLRLGREPGRVVSRETLMADVWDVNWFGSTKTLDVHVASLRSKLAAAGPGTAGTPVISTVRGRGYRLEDPGRSGK
ncbi:response regulator transcription factor [Arthrobacter sp. UYEF20]|uniref:response regulator transcription factor n=1 Tax=Arthrobacter sp. UYEF20 TaxID=1756363 RepID=UPI003392C9BE